MPLSYPASRQNNEDPYRWAGYEVSDLRLHESPRHKTVSRLPRGAAARFRRNGNAAVAGGRDAPRIARVAALAQTRPIVVQCLASCRKTRASGKCAVAKRTPIARKM